MDDTIARDPSPASGRFVLRIDPGLHAALRDAARKAGLSLNDYCRRKLSSPAAHFVEPAAEVLGRAASLFGSALMGVIAFGSWARGAMGEGSDVDILVAVDPDTRLTRALYRTWDAGPPLTWEGHEVEPHFACLPAPEAAITGLWAETAVEGVILFDRDLTVSRRLVGIRTRILAGEVVRREAHGQPYWVGAD